LYLVEGIVMAIEKMIEEKSVMPLIEELKTTTDYWDNVALKNALASLSDFSTEPLILTLEKEDYLLCSDVKEILVEIGEKAIPTLIQYLNNPDYTDKDSLLDILEKIGEPAINYLIEEIRNSNRDSDCCPEFRLSDVLGNIGEVAIVPLLINFKNELWNEEKLFSMKYVLKSFGKIIIVPVIDILKEEGWHKYKKRLLINVVADFDEDASEILMGIVTDNYDKEKQMIAAEILNEIHSVKITDVIMSLHKNNEEFIWTKEHYNAEDIAKMDTTKLQHGIAQIFENMNYTVELRPKSRDFGADLIATRYGKNRFAIQIKNTAEKVTLGAVQQVVTSKKHFFCTDAIVIANNDFTEPAKELAISNKVALVNRDGLQDMIASYPRKQNLHDFCLRLHYNK
jgi:HJR/Mrr/RecB family endonuclease